MNAEQAKAKAIETLEAVNTEQPSWTMANQIKLAICRFVLDEAGVEDEKVRQAAGMAFMATPSWFGASANAMTESGVVEARPRGQKVITGIKV